MDFFKKESSNPEPKCSPDRPSSPNDCAICLEQLKDKSFTNSCLHMFCFRCLEAWSKVKAECPLCKQDFCSIIHNIRSMTDYDEYHVPPVEARLAVTPPYVSPNEIADDYFSSSHDFFSNRRRFFSYRTTIMPHALSIERVRSSNLVIQPYVDNLELENNFSRVSAMHSPMSRCNRAEIYLKELETRPPSTGRHRECSPQFYRENVTQLHRLARWLHRELSALSQIGVRFVVHDVQHIIMDMLLVYNMNSPVFSNILSQHLGPYTTRFIREFYHFATSPYEMDQYDRECIYVRRRNNSHLSFIVTVGRDDSEDVQVIPSSSMQQPVRSWLDTNRISSLAYQDSTSSVTLTSRIPNRNSFQRSNEPIALNSSNSVINLTDSDNDDCIIIDNAVAPETIVLDDSDDDNMAVSTQSRLSPITFNSPCSDHAPLDLSTSRTISSQTSDSPHVEFLSETAELGNGSSESKNTLFPAETIFDIIRHHSKHRRRSCSDSSVLSTSISSIESNNSRRRKKNKRACKSKPGRQTYRKFSSDDFTCESSAKSAENDSDWEESRRKRKKKTKKSHVSKREKKSSSRKRKKSTERKSKKKKNPEIVNSVELDRNEERSKKQKTTCEQRLSVIVEHSRSSAKLSSVVKVVHRQSDFDTWMDQPSTSSGYRGNDNRFVNFDRSIHLSDSD